jgi:hypothetical protein
VRLRTGAGSEVVVEGFERGYYLRWGNGQVGRCKLLGEDVLSQLGGSMLSTKSV